MKTGETAGKRTSACKTEGKRKRNEEGKRHKKEKERLKAQITAMNERKRDDG